MTEHRIPLSKPITIDNITKFINNSRKTLPDSFYGIHSIKDDVLILGLYKAPSWTTKMVYKNILDKL